MKKIRKEKHDRMTARRFARRRRRRGREEKRKRKQKRKYSDVDAAHARRLYREKMREYVVLRAPKTIALARRESHSEIVSLIQNLKIAVLREGKKVCIDFYRTEKLYADGTLLLFAEIETLVRRRPGSVTCKQSSKTLVNEVFNHIGLFELLDCKCSVLPASDSAIGWHFIRGASTDFEAAGPVLERVSPELAPHLFVGLGEAATNTRNHAYRGEREDGFGLKETKGWWWLFYRTNPAKKRFTVVFCDLGAGIPRTIETTLRGQQQTEFQQALSVILKVAGLSSAHDGNLIHAAVQSRRSSTGLRHRGKGLGQIRHVIESVGTGRLAIFSNAGAYFLRRDPSSGESEQAMRYAESIYGTMVTWSIPIQEPSV